MSGYEQEWPRINADEHGSRPGNGVGGGTESEVWELEAIVE